MVDIRLVKYGVLVLIWITSFTGCGNSTVVNVDYSRYVHEGISMKQAIAIAQKEGKYLWTVIGSAENCGHTTEFLKALTVNGFFKQYQDQFVFYSCNVEKPENEAYMYAFLPPAIPNAYIFDKGGKVVSLFQFRPQESSIDYVQEQVEALLNGRPQNPDLLNDYAVGGKRLLRHLDLVLEIADMSLSSDKDSLLTAKTKLLEIDSLNRNYYHYYLLTQVAGKLGDTLLRNESAEKAYQILSSARNPVRFTNLNDRIKSYSATYQEEQIKSAKLQFEKEEFVFGKIKKGQIHSVSFTVANKGSAPLVIFDTQTSCDCVQITFPKAPILPGGSATVKIDYHANVKGVFLRSIMFISNASNKMQKIILEGEVV